MTCTRSGLSLRLFVTTAGLLAAGSAAQAGLLAEFSMYNHPDGSVAEPYYGMRYDGLYGGDNVTFSVGQTEETSTGTVKVFQDDNTGALSIHLSGTAYGGIDSGSDWAAASGPYPGPTTYAFDYWYTEGVAAVADGWVVNGAHAANTGTLTRVSDSTVMVADMGSMTSDGIAFALRADGWRLSGDETSWVGRGWFAGIHDRDWLFRGALNPDTSVPTPGAAALAALSLGVAGIRRRRA